MATNIIILIMTAVFIVVFIRNQIKLNERNGMFYYAVFGLYLKEKGLSKEEIESILQFLNKTNLFYTFQIFIDRKPKNYKYYERLMERNKRQRKDANN